MRNIHCKNTEKSPYFTSLLKLSYDHYFWKKKSLSFVGLPRRPRSVRNHDRSCTAGTHVTPPTSFLTCQLLLRNSHDFWVRYIQPKADSRRSYDFSCGLPGWTCQSTINSAWRPYGCFTIVKKSVLFSFSVSTPFYDGIFLPSLDRLLCRLVRSLCWLVSYLGRLVRSLCQLVWKLCRIVRIFFQLVRYQIDR